MARSDRRAILPDKHFIRVFKAAVRKTLQQEAAEAAALRERELSYQRLRTMKRAHAAAAKIAAMRYHMKHVAPSDPLRPPQPEATASTSGDADHNSSEDDEQGHTDDTGKDTKSQNSSTYAASAVDLESSMLHTMCSLVCCSLDHAHAVVFRTLVSLQQSARGGLITQAEADFVLGMLREGPSKVRANQTAAQALNLANLQHKTASTEPSSSSLMENFSSMMFDHTIHDDDDGYTAGGASLGSLQHSPDLLIQSANAAASNWMHPPPGTLPPGAHLRPASAFLQSIAQGGGSASQQHLGQLPGGDNHQWPTVQCYKMIARLEANYPDSLLVRGLTASIQANAGRWYAHLSAPTPHSLHLRKQEFYMSSACPTPSPREHLMVSAPSDAMLSAASKSSWTVAAKGLASGNMLRSPSMLSASSRRPPSSGVSPPPPPPEAPALMLPGLPEPWATRMESHPALQMMLTSLMAPASMAGATGKTSLCISVNRAKLHHFCQETQFLGKNTHRKMNQL